MSPGIGAKVKMSRNDLETMYRLSRGVEGVPYKAESLISV